MKLISRFNRVSVADSWGRARPLGPMVVRLVVLVAMLILTPIVQAAESDTPIQAVKSTITELLHVIKGQKESGRTGQRRWEVEQVIRRHVSYGEMAKRSLGEPWVGLDDSERQEFVGLFVQVLRDALANRIFEYSDEQILFLSERQEQNCAKVATRLWGHKVDTAVEFRLTHQSGQWLLYDAVIDGMSLVSNYRAQFSAIIRDVSYPGLIARMKQRTLVVKVFEGRDF